MPLQETARNSKTALPYLPEDRSAAKAATPAYAAMRQHFAARTARYERLIAILGTLIAIFTLGFAVHLMQRDRAHSIDLWTESARVESLALSAYIRQTLAASDLVLRSVHERVQASEASSVSELRELLGTFEIHEILRNRQSGVPQVSVVSVVDLNGDMVNFTRNYPPRSNTGSMINLSERDYFRAHVADPKLDLYLSVPVENKGTGAWTFYLVRKIRAPKSGKMLGVVLTGLESAYFQGFLSQIGSEGRRYVMLHSNGHILGRWPTTIGTVGKVLNSLTDGDAEKYEPDPDSVWETIVEFLAPMMGLGRTQDSVPALEVSAAVNDYPVSLQVGVTGEVIRNSWRPAAVNTLALAGVLAGIVLTLTHALMRLLQRNARMIGELERARSLAEAATAAKANFIATMSHEIRTPMNAIVGLIESLSHTPLDEKQQSIVGVVSDSADTLLRLVNEVLDFSRIESNGDKLRETTFSVAKLIDETIAIARALPGAGRLKMVTSIDTSVPTFLYGDKDRIGRVLVNLLSNSVKYTEAGSIHIRVYAESATADSAVICFSVSDSGTGIAEDMRERIFEPFEQASPALSSSRGGTGLGLSISRSIATMMNGTLTLAETNSRGSTFVLRVPLKIGGTLTVAPRPEVLANSLTAGLSVLVAEDTSSSQLVLKLMLETLGMHVLVVDNGAKAVAAAAESKFDIIFLDVQMPVMDGLEAARKIRRHFAQSQDTPPLLVGISALAEDSDRQRGLEAGLDEYLVKPIRANDVNGTINRLLLPQLRTPMGAAKSPPDAAPTAPPASGAAILADLLAQIGPESFDETLEQFERDAIDIWSQLDTAIDAGDLNATKRLAHRLKGLFGQFGASEASAQAQDIETQAPERLLAAARSLSARIPAAVAEARTLARQVRQSNRP